MPKPAEKPLLYDTVFILDWSARSAPSPKRPAADAIWLGQRPRGRAATATYFRTRDAACDALTSQLIDEIGRGRRVLLGVDFALGYPAGFADAAGLAGKGPPWRRTWDFLADAIDDSPTNANNRFDVARTLNRRIARPGPGPFWACPPAAAGPHLTAKRPVGLPKNMACENTTSGAGLARRRLVEQRIPSAHETWKLYTTGSVGSQTLLGIPRLAALRRHPALKNHLRIWPFETGFTAEPLPPHQPGVVIAEVYPSLVNEQADKLLATRNDVTVRDQAQVLALAEHFTQLDRRSRLPALFAPPEQLSADESRRCINEEGWVWGGYSLATPRRPRCGW